MRIDNVIIEESFRSGYTALLALHVNNTHFEVGSSQVSDFEGLISSDNSAMAS